MRYLFVFVLLAGATTVALACDVCGCSAGGNYFGILPRFGKHFLGIRYQYSASGILLAQFEKMVDSSAGRSEKQN